MARNRIRRRESVDLGALDDFRDQAQAHYERQGAALPESLQGVNHRSPAQLAAWLEANAPPEVVAKEREKQAEAEAELQTLLAQLDALKAQG